MDVAGGIAEEADRSGNDRCGLERGRAVALAWIGAGRGPNYPSRAAAASNPCDMRLLSDPRMT
jgi:hypothetical protein